MIDGAWQSDAVVSIVGARDDSTFATDAFFVFLMVQFVRTLPRELDEAARIDGASNLRIY